MDFFRARLPDDAQANALVERALFLAATGYSYVEERTESSDKGGDKVTRTKKQVAPSVSAISLWLGRRMPEKWGDAAMQTPENNLLILLRQAWEGGAADAVSALQSQAGAGDDVVEYAAHT